MHKPTLQRSSLKLSGATLTTWQFCIKFSSKSIKRKQRNSQLPRIARRRKSICKTECCERYAWRQSRALLSAHTRRSVKTTKNSWWSISWKVIAYSTSSFSWVILFGHSIHLISRSRSRHDYLPQPGLILFALHGNNYAHSLSFLVSMIGIPLSSWNDRDSTRTKL